MNEHTMNIARERKAEKEMREMCWQWLCSSPGITQNAITALIHYFGSPVDVYKAKTSEFQPYTDRGLKWAASLIAYRERTTILQAREHLEQMSIRFVSREDPSFPQRLINIPDCPYGLFYRGCLPREEKGSVAIVGARRCSNYGREMAQKISRELTREGYQIISGMAAGIDGTAQSECLREGGSSYAVEGCGVERYYPPENGILYRMLCTDGKSGVISEFGPGTPPLGRNFPLRNRLISGLADAVIVVEAGRQSGSLITADLALDQGKDVYAVPGRYNDLLSCGCNRLIGQGAGIISSTDSLIEDLAIHFELKRICRKEEEGSAGPQDRESRITSISDARKIQQDSSRGKTDHARKEDSLQKRISSLPESQQAICRFLDSDPRGIDELLARTGLPLPVLLQGLVSLQVEGVAEEVSKNRYSLAMIGDGLGIGA